MKNWRSIRNFHCKFSLRLFYTALWGVELYRGNCGREPSCHWYCPRICLERVWENHENL